MLYFDNASTSKKPGEIIANSAQYLIDNDGSIEGGYASGNTNIQMVQEVRAKVAKHFNAEINNTIFSNSTTDGINLIADGLFNELDVNSEIVITEIDHHANQLPWIKVAKRKNATILVARVEEYHKDESHSLWRLNKEHLLSLINHRTKIVAINHVSNSNGSVLDIVEVSKRIKEINPRAIIIVDGAQSCSTVGIDFRNSGVDTYIFSGHKFYSLYGVGVSLLSDRILEVIEPSRVGGKMVESVDLDNMKVVNRDFPYSLESGTPNIHAIYSLGLAIDYVQGNDYSKLESLTNYTLSKLTQFDLTLYSDKEVSPNIISFNHKLIDSNDLSLWLFKSGVAIRSGNHCTAPLMQRMGINGNIRISLGYSNTRDEVDQFLKILDDVVTKLT